jgi:membrane protein CcdC involved in cytochrome C biogenesis
MSTGLSMFLIPMFRVPWLWAMLSFAVGAVVLAVPLMRTSRLTLEENTVTVRRSSSFFLVIIALASMRFFARRYIGAYVSFPQTASLSFLLAFGMIIRWRVAMYFEYKRLVLPPSLFHSASAQE